MPNPLRSNDIAALVLKQVETAHALSECAIRHAGAVNAYHAARDAAEAWTHTK
jgi:hypothetical protein